MSRGVSKTFSMTSATNYQLVACMHGRIKQNDCFLPQTRPTSTTGVVCVCSDVSRDVSGGAVLAMALLLAHDRPSLAG